MWGDEVSKMMYYFNMKRYKYHGYPGKILAAQNIAMETGLWAYNLLNELKWAETFKVKLSTNKKMGPPRFHHHC